MALVLADRVQETTATTGTGSITLSGAVTGYQSFAVVGDGNTCYYTIVNGSAWEVGIGTYSTTGPTLARTTVLSNSSGNTSPITLSGSSSVFLTYPAEKSVNLDVDGVLAVGAPLGYSDTGILATFVSTETDYNQVVIQNKSNSSTASANLNISNNVSTDTTGFAELGINSSTFTGPGSFDIAGAAYLASASTDLTIGTYGAYNIHFVTNSNATDAMTIYDDGGISLGELANPGIGNIACNNINLKFQQVVTAAGTTTLTNASPYYTQFTGTTTQTLQLPDATTCLVGTTFILDNDSTGNITIKDGAGTTFELLIPGGVHNFILEDNSTVAGTWIRYSSVPSTVEWGTNSLQLGSTVVTGGTWQGGTVQPGYGGTGLTTFVAANNALYSTGTSTLTAGTLPVAAGGTGLTSLTANYIPVGNGTSAFTSSSSLQFASGVLVVGGSSVLGGATNPITAFTGSANNYIQTYVYNQSTGASASADFVAYGNNSTDAHGWADLGFTGSGYNDPVYTVTGPNEAYVFGSALNSSYTGNLVYATDSTGSANAHQWYVGGFTQAKSAWKMQLTSTGLQLANALAVAYGGTGVTTSTGSGSNVLSTSPTLVTPILGTPQSGNFSTGTFTWPTFNQNTSGTAGGLSGTPNITVGTVNGTTITASSQFSGPGTGLSGTASSLSIGGNAATATTATTATNWGAYGAVPAAGTSFGTANTIGRSDASGYTYFGYINSSTANNENPTVSQVIVTNGSDNFYRKSSIASFTGYVQSNASGSWGISITGSAASASTANLSAYAGGAVHENVQTISSNYTMTSGRSGVSAGPITVNTGVTVTIPTGSSWVIV